MQCSDWDYIFTSDIVEILERYNLHKQGIYSFGMVYDDLPSIWLDCLGLLNSEEYKAQKSKEYQDKMKTRQ